jgi:hypothetical protein
MPTRHLRGLKNCFRGFFADHVDRAGDEKPRDARKDGSIDDANAARSVDAKVAGEDAAGISMANRASAARVVPPGMVADELPQLLIVLEVRAGRFLAMNQSAVLQRR